MEHRETSIVEIHSCSLENIHRKGPAEQVQLHSPRAPGLGGLATPLASSPQGARPTPASRGTVGGGFCPSFPAGEPRDTSCACALRLRAYSAAARLRLPLQGPLCAGALSLLCSQRSAESVCRSLSSEQAERRGFASPADRSLFPLPLSRPTFLFTPLLPLLLQPWRSRRRSLSSRPSPRRPPGPSRPRPAAVAGARERAPPWGRRAAAPLVLVRRVESPAWERAGTGNGRQGRS